MSHVLSKLLKGLKRDPWRDQNEFSQDMEFANRQVLDAKKSEFDVAESLRDWLADNQPCLFGRMAAGDLDLVSFCILRDADLAKSEEYVRDKIRDHRLLWRREAVEGRRSGFIIAALSNDLTYAEPNQALLEVAKRLCFLYLRKDIQPDEIYMDSVTLAIGREKDSEAEFYSWNVGANFFGAAGDKRWWHDHRIPGGIAFSMNSVGHMARNGALRRLMNANESGRLKPLKGKLGIDSLAAALKFAMLTISGAQATPSGPATCLRKMEENAYAALEPKCPFAQSVPPKLKLLNYKQYDGWYHTDVTVPSDYFRPDINRPTEVQPKELDFTYLFDDSIENPDFETTGLGGRIL